MKFVGRIEDEEGSRELYVVHLATLSEWPSLSEDELWNAVVESDAQGFALFIAIDASTLSTNDVADFASYAIGHGVFWVSTWGPDCERVHDIFDWEDVGDGSEPEKPIVMTTWHDDEALDEAVLLFWTAFADDGKPAGPVRVALAVGPMEWFEALQWAAEHHLAGSS